MENPAIAIDDNAAKIIRRRRLIEETINGVPSLQWVLKAITNLAA
ncbi:hypothetical protein RRSWK_04668 [Rhodopirellula sp. SWK7]|nr:hypothetical protein RRSWK_04668 [Rhodopirellula sp. SWK7]